MDLYAKREYSTKFTLMGNWVAERATDVIQNHKHSTTYSQDFGLKPLTTNNPEIVWDRKLDAEGYSILPTIVTNESSNFFDNYSTIYDLAFNHFPKWYCDRQFTRKNPKLEYIQNYGNSTSNGLTEYMQDKWNKEKNYQTKSLYQDSYVKYYE